MRNDTSDLAAQAARAAPAAAGAVASAVTMSEWVAIATITYVIVQAGYLVWKWRWEHIEKTEARAREQRREDREHRESADATARLLAEQCLPAGCPVAAQSVRATKQDVP